jgi:hypothetical protein
MFQNDCSQIVAMLYNSRFHFTDAAHEYERFAKARLAIVVCVLIHITTAS